MPTSRRKVTSDDLRNEVLTKIKTYEESGFLEAGAIHELIMNANPKLCPRLWYGMPGYAKTKDSAVLCFFRKDTLISFGISEAANIGTEDSMVSSAWYITKLNKDVEAKIQEIVASSTK